MTIFIFNLLGPWRKALVAGLAAGILTCINVMFDLNIPISTSGDIAQTISIAIQGLISALIGGWATWRVPEK